MEGDEWVETNKAKTRIARHHQRSLAARRRYRCTFATGVTASAQHTNTPTRSTRQRALPFRERDEGDNLGCAVGITEALVIEHLGGLLGGNLACPVASVQLVGTCQAGA